MGSYLGFWSGAGFLITSFLAIIMSVRPRYSETGLLEKVLYIFLMTLTSLISAGTCWLLVLLQLSPVFWCGEVATSTNEVIIVALQILAANFVGVLSTVGCTIACVAAHGDKVEDKENNTTINNNNNTRNNNRRIYY